MIFKFSLPVFLFLFISSTQAQVFTNKEDAFSFSAKTGKPVFLIFSGSDWCRECISFEKNILSDSAFVKFASNNLTILKIDFPQRKQISKEIQKHNETLAEQYNPNGQFPHILLLRSDKSVNRSFQYRRQTAGEFISEILSSL